MVAQETVLIRDVAPDDANSAHKHIADSAATGTVSITRKKLKSLIIRSISTSYTLDVNDELLEIDTSGGDVTITLFPATANEVGQKYELKIIAGNNRVYIVPNGGDQVELLGEISPYAGLGVSQGLYVSSAGQWRGI